MVVSSGFGMADRVLLCSGLFSCLQWSVPGVCLGLPSWLFWLQPIFAQPPWLPAGSVVLVLASPFGHRLVLVILDRSAAPPVALFFPGDFSVFLLILGLLFVWCMLDVATSVDCHL